jgi:amino acid adenylation domain-containing protein
MPYQTNILEYLEKTALDHADKTAFSCGADKQSFSELMHASRSVGSFLLFGGFWRKSVLILMEKHPNTVAAMLGVVYAGCFYTVLDSSVPWERIRNIVNKLRPAAVIYDKINSDIAHTLPDGITKYPYEIACSSYIDTGLLGRTRAASLDTDIVYVSFTSGSTGEPKGVAADHRSVIDYTEALTEAIGFDGDCIFGGQASLCLDAPLKEIMTTLKLGASTCFIPRRLFTFPVQLCRYLEENGVNTLCWAVSALVIISSLGLLEAHAPKGIRTVCFGGEVFPRAEYEKWRRAYPNVKFVNLYGPTEATGMSCYWICDRELDDGESIPIGRPFRNTEILLINDDGERAAFGELGEIYIRGSCVTAGYFDDFERTRASFVQNPLNKSYPEIVYKTGDIARLNSRGELVFVGRRDMQIKHMGYRIELGEIEAAAECLDGIARACAEYDAASRRITLFYVGEVQRGVLAAHLKQRLPAYMIPSRINALASIPVTAGGKTDRAALHRQNIGR